MKHILFCCLLFVSTFCWATDRQPYARHIDVSIGLPSNNVYSVLQDSRGFIWLATEDGLSRFDGHNFKRYYSSAQTSRAGSYLQEDSLGRIWYGNFDGRIYYIQNDSLFEFEKNRAPFSFRFGIVEQGLFCTAGSSLLIYDIVTLKLVRQQTINRSAFSSAYPSGKQYIVVTDSVNFYNSNGTLFRSLPNKFSFSGLNFIVPFADSFICVNDSRSGGGFMKLRQDSFTRITSKYNFKFVNHVSLNADKLGVSTPSGAYFFNTKFQLVDSLFTDKNIATIYTDRQGNNWVATLGDGLYCIPTANQFITSLGDNEPTTLLQINNTTLAGTLQGQVWEYNNSTMMARYIGTVNAAKEIYELYNSTTSALSPKQVSHLNYNNSQLWVADIGCKQIEPMTNGFVALGFSSGVYLWPTEANGHLLWEKYYRQALRNNVAVSASRLAGALLLKSVRCKALSYSLTNDALYASTNIGLYKLSPVDSLPILWQGQSIYAKQICSAGSYVYALLNNGILLQIDKNNLAEKSTLCSATASFIKTINQKVYLVANDGIYQIDGNEHCQKISSLYITEAINDIVLLENRLLVATKNGIINLQINTFDKVGLPLHVYIDGLLANQNKVYQSTPEFNYNENDITIQYAMPNPAGIAGVSLYYSINDGSWQSLPDYAQELHLASLSPGSYSISFKINEQVQADVVRFTISRPWWQQWWFVLLCLAIFSLVVFGIYRWQLQLVKQRGKLEMEKIQLEKNLRQSMLSSIKSQMNPHFLFNALNTIQSFIVSEDKKNASGYLSKFSKLTRMVLEMSEHETVSLREEIQALQLYLELEKMRFDDLNFDIKPTHGLPIDEIKLPSMIIQPYVENAIKHGLLHKKTDRRLTIAFEKAGDDLLKIVVDDNGVGRQKSSELNKIKIAGHRSFSTSANLKRIELLNKENKNIGVVYFDKPNDSGTTVTIQVPIYN